MAVFQRMVINFGTIFVSVQNCLCEHASEFYKIVDYHTEFCVNVGTPY